MYKKIGFSSKINLVAELDIVQLLLFQNSSEIPNEISLLF